jgi:hypothetical protein
MPRGGIAALAALLLAACDPSASRQDAARPTAWRIAAVADAPADATQKAAAAAILAWFQDTQRGSRFAAGDDPLCIGVGPASGGPFRFQPLHDLDGPLLERIARTRPNARGVSECATTLKGAPYRLVATDEPARLVACLHAGGDGQPALSLLCGFYDTAIDNELIGYDVEVAADAVIVRRNGRGVGF